MELVYTVIGYILFIGFIYSIYLFVSRGYFCKLVGHKLIAYGWYEKYSEGVLMERRATDFYCERCLYKEARTK